MRKSLERHPLAVLRRIIGRSQEQFAEKTGLSMSTISKIESLRLPLSIEHAMLIEDLTGCSAEWLCAGDVKAPPCSAFILPEPQQEWLTDGNGSYPLYNLDTFLWVDSRRAAGLPLEDTEHKYSEWNLAMDIQTILLACHKAKRRGNDKFARIKLYNLATQFAREMGQSEITDEGAPEFALELLDAVRFCLTTGSLPKYFPTKTETGEIIPPKKRKE